MKRMTGVVALFASMMIAHAVDAPEWVADEAAFWFDASTLTEAAGTDLDTWSDVRGEGYPSLSTYTSTKPQVIEIANGDLAGKKAVTFFSLGTVCDMNLPETKEVKTAFFVVDLDQLQHAFLLGGPSNGSGPRNYGFHRGTGGTYRYENSLGSVQYWNDGKAITNPQGTLVPTGYQLITWSWDSAAQVNAVCNDRGISGRIGGKRLCEVVAFARNLTIVERCAVEGYLKAKWFGGISAADAATEMLGKKAQVHFDASVSSSFHFDVDGDDTGTKVSRWDDLSGNENHFSPCETWGTKNGINPGTVGEVGGKPVFDSGSVSSGIDLKLAERITNTRTVFLVADLDRAEHVFWLADSPSGTYRFHRGGGGVYSNPSYNYVYKYGAIWANGQKIIDQGQQYPEPPGGLTVYTLRVSQNCEWNTLGQDRNIANRNGGKRVAELYTFDYELPDADREAVEALLMAKWSPSEEYVDALIAAAPVHVDASNPENFIYDGGTITGWKNQGTGDDLAKPAKLYYNEEQRDCNPGAYGYTNGVPAFLMGPHSSYIDMYFTRLTNVRTVFWVMDIVPDKDAFFLADGKNEVIQNAGSYHFHRGYTSANMGYYSTGEHAAGGYKCGPMFCDGSMVVSMTAERPPLGAHVYDLTSIENLTASSLSADRWCNHRNGGRAISELLVLTTPVSGLTRDIIRKRIEAKWTRSCGWAGAGAAAWGAGNYRVFGADAEVPAEGAEAVGVGFTASAAMAGGTLTLGDGGLFASEGTEVTVSAPLAGRLGAYGPGTVKLTRKLDSVDALSVGYGATLVLPPGGAIDGVLSVQQNGRILLDVSALAAKEHVVMTFGSVLLPAGGSLYDYVTLTGGEDQGHFFTLSADGTELHVNDPNAAVTAEWIGGEGADPADPASWICRNQDNAVVDGVVPAHSTVSVTFTQDGDLRALGPVTFAENTTFDLNGHVVRIAAFTGPGYSLTSVINSAESDTAELHVDVANGKTLTNDTTLISGNVKLVKDGAGTLSVAKSGQSYTGGTEIADGIFETLPVKHFSPERHLLGSNGNTTTVRTGARFRLNALYGEADADYRFVLDGGTMEGCGEDLPNGWGQFHHIELTANSTFIVTTHTGMRPGGSFRATTIDLGGYTLTVQIGTNGKIFYLYDTTILNGMLDVTSGGWLEIGKIYTDGMAAQDVDIRVGSALRINASASVRNYEQVYGSDNNNGTGELNVYGTFTPAASHNYFYGCTMRDGSTIDLSGKTGAWSTKSAFSNGRNTVTFASGATVTIKLEGRGDLRELSKSASPYVVTWPTDENGITDVPENVTFTPDAWTLQNRYLLRQDATGLRLLYSAGTVIIVR